MIIMKKLGFETANYDNALKEAEKVLTYTLLLPRPQHVADSDEQNWVSASLDMVYSNCIQKLFHRSYFDFFGHIFTDNSIFWRLRANYFDHPSYLFPYTIMQQCVISAYDMAASYSTTFETTYSHCPTGNTNSETATRISNVVRKHVDILKAQNFTEIFYFKPNPKTAEPSTQIQSSQSNLFYKLNAFEGRKLNTALKLYNYTDDSPVDPRCWDRLTILYHDLYECCNCDTVADQLLYYYRLENIFGASLLQDIVHEINKVKNQGHEYPDGINDFRSLALINRLPNVFSRKLYLEYAFSAINQSFSKEAYFFNDLFDLDVVAKITKPEILKLHTWRLFFERFCRLFSDLIFPASEWYFLLTLLKTMYYYKPTLKEEGNEQERYAVLKNLLSGYLENQKDDLLLPFQNILNKDYKIIEPAFKELSSEFSLRNISLLLTSFRECSKGISLSLPLLTKDSCVANMEQNRKIITSNYMTIISSAPLE